MSDYINNSASAGELARLDHQAALVGKATGLLPMALEGITFTTVLDVGCGPGRWALDFAFRSPDTEVAGIDVSPIMVDYANARARTQRLHNASFGAQDFLEAELSFAEGSFDLIHLRFAVGWVKGYTAWQQVLTRCFSLLTPGGYVVVTEGEGIYTNSLAVQRMQEILCEALYRMEYSLSVSPHFFGVVTQLGSLLYECGFHAVQTEAHVLDYSHYNEEENRAQLTSFQRLLIESAPFLLKSGVTTVAEMAEVDQKMAIDMYHHTFCGIGPLFTFFAQKPGKKEEASSAR